jgi:hypothetical protein
VDEIYKAADTTPVGRFPGACVVSVMQKLRKMKALLVKVHRWRIGKWRMWCWLGGYGVGGGRVFKGEGRG